MALRRHTDDQPAGTWGFAGLGNNMPSKEAEFSSATRPHLRQDARPNLESRKSSGLGIKRAADYGQMNMSNDPQESPPQKIKLEDISEEWPWAPKYDGLIDLTGDSSDDESVRRPASQETSKQNIHPIITTSAAEVGPEAAASSLNDKMTDVTHTPASSSQAKVTSASFSVGGSSTADDSKPCVAGTLEAPHKYAITTTPFNIDDSDSETEAQPAARLPKTGPHRAWHKPQVTHVPDEKLTEQKAAQRKLAAELRRKAEMKRAARVAEKERNATQKPPPSSSIQRPTPYSDRDSDSMAAKSCTKSLSAKKSGGASVYATGRRLELGRLSSTKTTASATSSHEQSKAKNTRNGAHSTKANGHAALTKPGSTNPSHSTETSQNSNSQPMSNLQSVTITKNGDSMKAPSKLSNPVLPPPIQKSSKKVTWSVAEEAPLLQHPSMAANLARSHTEKLKEIPSSLALTSEKNGRNGLSQAQNEELFGENDYDIEEVVVAAAVRPKQFIDLAAHEDSMDRAVKKDEIYKAHLANKLSQAQKDEIRAAEQRRRIEDGKAEKDRVAQEAAAKKKQEDDEYSRVVMKKREDRVAEEAWLAEEMRLKSVKLQTSLNQKQKEIREAQRKKLAARKAQIPVLSEQQEHEKHERIRKKQETNARKHAAEAQAEAEATLTLYDDSGELVLEGETTPSQNLQGSQHVSSAHPGQASLTQTGPYSLNSAKGTNAVQNSIARSNISKPTLIDQRIAQEARGWTISREKSSKEGVFTTPFRKTQEKVSAFFTGPTSARNFSRDQGSISPTAGAQAARKTRASHTRKLGTVLAQDAKLIQWRDQEDMEWGPIRAAWLNLTGKGLSDGTLRKRYRQVRDAVNEAKVPFRLMQLLASGNEDARKQVNSMLEAGNANPAAPKGSVTMPALGGGPIKLAPLSQRTSNSSLWQDPNFELEEEMEDVDVENPRSALDTLAAPAGRPTTGGKCMAAVLEMIGKQYLEAANEDSDDGVDESKSSVEHEEAQDEEDPYYGFEAEDFQPYGFQVQRRELSTEDAEMGFPIENQEWMPCGGIYRNCGDANGAAMAEVVTIMPGGPFYANPADAPCLQYLENKTNRLHRFVFCQLVNHIHGIVQTTVDKVVQAPRARVRPPTTEEFHAELKVRETWTIVQQISIKPPSRTWDPLFESAPEERVEEEGRNISYSDYNLTTKRAIQAFVDTTYKSDLQSLDSRSQEKREKVEGYLAGILADKTFEGAMEIVEGMEGMAGIRTKYKVEEGSRITLAMWIEQGELRGPLN